MSPDRKHLILPLLVLWLAGLSCSILTQNRAPEIAPIVAPPRPSSTPEVCSVNPPGLMIEVLQGKKDRLFQSVTVKGIGFVSGEKLTIRLEGQGIEHGEKIETMDYAVDANGSFSVQESLQLDDPGMHWEAHVVHQHGIACLRFDTFR